MDNYCRLCMSEENLKLLDDNLTNCVRNEFSVQIHPGDQLSNEICAQCCEFILQLMKFKEKIQKVQKLLQKILKRKNVDIDRGTDANNETIPDVVVDKVTLETGESDTVKKAHENELIKKIVKSINLDKVKNKSINSPQKISKKYSLDKNLMKPLKLLPKNKSNENEEPDLEIKEEPGNGSLKNHICKICHKAFGFTESLNNHIRRHHKGTYFCIKCAYMTISKKLYAAHVRDHLKLTSQQKLCNVCFEVCNSNLELKQHQKLVHTSVLLICSVCQLKFMNATSLKKHKRDMHWMHDEQSKNCKKFKCKKCNRKFISILVLDKHQCVAKKFPCLKNCGKRFESFAEMNRHSTRCVVGNTIYNCKKCKKNLKSLASYKRHVTKCSTEMINVAVPSTSKCLESNNNLCLPAQISKNHVMDFKENYENRITEQPVTEKIHEKLVKSLKSSKRKTTSKKQMKSKQKIFKTADEKIKFKVIAKESERSPIDALSSQSDLAKSCRICGLVFKNDDFLKKHELISHSSVNHENEKTTHSSTPKLRNELMQPSFWKQSESCQTSNINQNVQSTHEIHDRYNISTPQKLPEDNSSMHAIKSSYQKCDSDSSSKLLKSQEEKNKSDRNYSNFAASLKTCQPSPHRNGQFSSAYDGYRRPQPRPTLNSMLKSDYLRNVNARKPINTQVTIIQNCQSICNVCKNSEPHFFCKSCNRCFLENQSQYFNHMKMKHS